MPTSRGQFWKVVNLGLFVIFLNLITVYVYLTNCLAKMSHFFCVMLGNHVVRSHSVEPVHVDDYNPYLYMYCTLYSISLVLIFNICQFASKIYPVVVQFQMKPFTPATPFIYSTGVKCSPTAPYDFLSIFFARERLLLLFPQVLYDAVSDHTVPSKIWWVTVGQRHAVTEVFSANSQ